MEERRIEIHQNAWDRLPHLPEMMVFDKVAAFSDGGTGCLCGRIPTDIDFRICLSPVDSPIYMGRPGRLSISESGKPPAPYRIYEIVARSDLETQILGILKSPVCRGAMKDVLDRIVDFVESNRYVELYCATEAKPTASENEILGTPTPGLIVIDHGPSMRSYHK